MDIWDNLLAFKRLPIKSDLTTSSKETSSIVFYCDPSTKQFFCIKFAWLCIVLKGVGYYNHYSFVSESESCWKQLLVDLQPVS